MHDGRGKTEAWMQCGDKKGPLAWQISGPFCGSPNVGTTHLNG